MQLNRRLIREQYRSPLFFRSVQKLLRVSETLASMLARQEGLLSGGTAMKARRSHTSTNHLGWHVHSNVRDPCGNHRSTNEPVRLCGADNAAILPCVCKWSASWTRRGLAVPISLVEVDYGPYAPSGD
ncbi:hypothetical protein PI125_g9393 [Phytophthora idaei]|nr:hypothetical protein PI125_g9393 [Phytophthora idaei]